LLVLGVQVTHTLIVEELSRCLARQKPRERAQRLVQSFARSSVRVNIRAFL
jgi:hypothetical protein